MVDEQTTPDPAERAASRGAHLLPEEASVGSDDPEAQAAQILRESDAREVERNAAPTSYVEHRRSDETVDTTATTS